MRGALVVAVLLVGVTANGQEMNDPRPLKLELRLLQDEREATSLALPLTLTIAGAHALVTGLVTLALDPYMRQGSADSVLAGTSLFVASFVLLPGLVLWAARLIERSMLDAHIRSVELALGGIP